MLDYFTLAHTGSRAAERKIARNENQSFELYQGLRSLWRPASQLATRLLKFREAIARRQAARDTAQVLMQLSDRQLQDIGVIRAEIPLLAVASSHAPGRPVAQLREARPVDQTSPIDLTAETRTPDRTLTSRAVPVQRSSHDVRDALKRAFRRRRDGVTPALAGNQYAATCCG